MEFMDVVKTRSANRRYKEDKVSRDIILKILEAGRLAPTAKNLQPQKIYVIESEEGLKKIDKASFCRYRAPIVLLICSDKDIAWKNGDYSTYEMDASIVATHIMLAATNYGVDNIWIEMFDKDIIKQEFQLESNIEPICLIPIGYKTEDYKGNPMHNIRKDLNEMVRFI